MNHVARYFEKKGNLRVTCLLCPHHCLIADGKRGICLTRRNENGILISDNFCRPVSKAYDPIEKKPLYHFYPGSTIFSTGPNGCTFKCDFCQNAQIAQELLAVPEIPPADLVHEALAHGSLGIAYTYSEPYIWFETIVEVAPVIRDRGGKNVMVTNGYFEEGPLGELLGVIDAMNVDIKSMDESFYRNHCKGELSPVLRTCVSVKKKAHLEITNLVITGENDSDDHLRRLAEWISGNLGRDTPLHLSRYFPRHRFSAPSTPESTLRRAYAIASEHLDYVYLGNMAAGEAADTHCPKCGKVLISRRGYQTTLSGLDPDSSRCRTCGTAMTVVATSKSTRD